MVHLLGGKVRAGKKLSGIDLFGEQIQMSAVKSNAGRPRVPLRTMGQGTTVQLTLHAYPVTNPS